MSTIKSLAYNRSLRKNTTIFEKSKNQKLYTILEGEEVETVEKESTKNTSPIQRNLPWIVRLWNFMK